VWADYLLFLLKTMTLVVAVVFILAAMAGMAGRVRSREGGQFVVRYLNDEFRERIQGLTKAVDKALLKANKPKGLLGKAAMLAQFARLKKAKPEAPAPEEQKTAEPAKDAKPESEAPAEATTTETPEGEQPAEQAEGETAETTNIVRTFVLRFEGDVEASAVASLREEVTAVLQMANPSNDAVLLVLESPGGMVTSYGLAAAQLVRLRNAGIHVTVAVDKVAASGGYMMAAVANWVVAAPFAVVGSIGVVATVPNINRLLKRNDIDIEQHTSGKFKRTLTLLGENTDEGRAKFRLELEEVHQLFKGFLQEFRPNLDLEKLATGEHWFGEQAIELGLIDEIGTSDEVIIDAINESDVFEIHYARKKRPLLARLNLAARNALFQPDRI